MHAHIIEEAFPFSTPAWKAGRYVSSMSRSFTIAGKLWRSVSCEYCGR